MHFVNIFTTLIFWSSALLLQPANAQWWNYGGNNANNGNTGIGQDLSGWESWLAGLIGSWTNAFGSGGYGQGGDSGPQPGTAPNPPAGNPPAGPGPNPPYGPPPVGPNPPRPASSKSTTKSTTLQVSTTKSTTTPIYTTKSTTAVVTSSSSTKKSITTSTTRATTPSTTKSTTSTTLSRSTTRSTTTTSSSTTTSATPSSTVCPSFWQQVVFDLGNDMLQPQQCNNISRAAIRYAFHDAGCYSSKTPFYAPAAGGADGSILLSSTEISRSINNGLQDYHDYLLAKLNKYQQAGYAIGAADLIQVAGALGVTSCPGGSIGQVLVGRQDTTQAPPEGLLPEPFGAGSDHNTILQLFQDKGFTARDLAALIGAHTTSVANFQTSNGIPVGTPQDTTPAKWDVEYYSDTYNAPSGVGRFASDINLASNMSSGGVGVQFKSFVNNQRQWDTAFQSAYQRLSLLGVPASVQQNMQDCTTVVLSYFDS